MLIFLTHTAGHNLDHLVRDRDPAFTLLRVTLPTGRPCASLLCVWNARTDVICHFALTLEREPPMLVLQRFCLQV